MRVGLVAAGALLVTLGPLLRPTGPPARGVIDPGPSWRLYGLPRDRSWARTPARTLYVFVDDLLTKAPSACTGDCAHDWVPMPASGSIVRGEGRDRSRGHDRAPRRPAPAHHGRAPLYLFSGDRASGDIRGNGVGNLWWAMTPSGLAATSYPLHALHLRHGPGNHADGGAARDSDRSWRTTEGRRSTSTPTTRRPGAPVTPTGAWSTGRRSGLRARRPKPASITAPVGVINGAGGTTPGDPGRPSPLHLRRRPAPRRRPGRRHRLETGFSSHRWPVGLVGRLWPAPMMVLRPRRSGSVDRHAVRLRRRHGSAFEPGRGGTLVGLGAWGLSACAGSSSPGATFSQVGGPPETNSSYPGALLFPKAYAKPNVALTDTASQPFNIATDTQHQSDVGLFRLHPLPRPLPAEHVHRGVGHQGHARR